ncbi:hypothetical protein J6590_071341 [Homalodisca vitripennis]|nr:hypothetical protein J6590_071341 [Homalodisca vitripennis]
MESSANKAAAVHATRSVSGCLYSAPQQLVMVILSAPADKMTASKGRGTAGGNQNINLFYIMSCLFYPSTTTEYSSLPGRSRAYWRGWEQPGELDRRQGVRVGHPHTQPRHTPANLKLSSNNNLFRFCQLDIDRMR